MVWQILIILLQNRKSRKRSLVFILGGFLDSSAGKESSCNAGELGSIPGLWSSPGEGISYPFQYSWASFMTQIVKNPYAMHVGDLGSISGLGISPGGGHGSPPQYSCLENSIDRGAWWATVHGIAKSWTQLSKFHFTSHRKCRFDSWVGKILWRRSEMKSVKSNSLRPHGL